MAAKTRTQGEAIRQAGERQSREQPNRDHHLSEGKERTPDGRRPPGESPRDRFPKESSARHEISRRQIGDDWPLDGDMDPDSSGDPSRNDPSLSDDIWDVFCDDGGESSFPDELDAWQGDRWEDDRRDDG